MSLLRELLTEEVQEYVIHSTDAPHYHSERAGEHVLGIKVKKTYTDKAEAEKHAKVLSDAGPRRYKVGPARKRVAEGQQSYIPAQMQRNTTARKMAEQLVKNAIQNFDERDELQAARKMAKGFYQNLLKHIDDAYNSAKMKKADVVDRSE